MTLARCGSRTAFYTGLGRMTRRRSVAYRRKASTASMNTTSKQSPCPWAAANDALARSARPTSDDRRRSDRGCRRGRLRALLAAGRREAVRRVRARRRRRASVIAVTVCSPEVADGPIAAGVVTYAPTSPA